MISSGAVTKQEFDEKQAAYNVSTANVSASRATLERLTQLKKFCNIVAPFAGVVTSRAVDVGMLVSSTVAVGARPLFTIAQTDTMRVITQVPQDAAPGVRVGQPVEVLVQELGNSAFLGKVSRTSEAIDPTTRTLQTSILVLNADGRLRPGMYAQVKFTTQRSQTALVIPANTLIIRADGPQTAVVREGKVHIAKITLGRDFGTSIEALSGLKAGDQIIINPGDDVAEGSTVRVVQPRVPANAAEGKKAP
jgi:RND family efflux transporter MFP subunit